MFRLSLKILYLRGNVCFKMSSHCEGKYLLLRQIVVLELIAIKNLAFKGVREAMSLCRGLHIKFPSITPVKVYTAWPQLKSGRSPWPPAMYSIKSFDVLCRGIQSYVCGGRKNGRRFPPSMGGNCCNSHQELFYGGWANKHEVWKVCTCSNLYKSWYNHNWPPCPRVGEDFIY